MGAVPSHSVRTIQAPHRHTHVAEVSSIERVTFLINIQVTLSRIPSQDRRRASLHSYSPRISGDSSGNHLGPQWQHILEFLATENTPSQLLHFTDGGVGITQRYSNADNETIKLSPPKPFLPSVPVLLPCGKDQFSYRQHPLTVTPRKPSLRAAILLTRNTTILCNQCLLCTVPHVSAAGGSKYLSSE